MRARFASLFNEVFPQNKQIGGSHYKNFHIQPYEFISKNDLTFFQGTLSQLLLVIYVFRVNNSALKYR